MKASRIVLLILVLSGIGIVCAAQQEPVIEIPPISFDREMVLPQYPIGSVIDIAVDFAQVERVGGPRDLKARIFRGSKDDLQTRSRFLIKDGCLFYRAGLYAIGRSAKGIKLLDGTGRGGLPVDVRWLSRETSTAGESQRYVLVLEKAGGAQDVLKIRPQDAGDYFRRGFEFIVKSTRGLNNKERDTLIETGNVSLKETIRVAEAVAQGAQGCRSFSRVVLAGSVFLIDLPCPEGQEVPHLAQTAEENEPLFVAP